MTENNEMTAEELAAMEAEQAKLEAEERARIEHENFLNSFPDTTVFYQELIENGDCIQLAGIVRDPATADAFGWINNHYDESELTAIPKGDHVDYYLMGHEPAAETPAEYIARREEEIKTVVQTLIDKTAHQKEYDDGLSCASYVGDPDEEFNADAVAFVAWRGRCWRTCYNILNSVKAGTVAPEDVTDQYVIDRLPVMEWPEV